MKEEFEIKITGSGTRDEIIKSLKLIIEGLEAETSDGVLDGAEWEDSTLCTEINAN